MSFADFIGIIFLALFVTGWVLAYFTWQRCLVLEQRLDDARKAGRPR